MNDRNGDAFDRIFKWIDFIKIALYALVAGAVALATWATRIQDNTLENKTDIERNVEDSQHYRDARHDQDVAWEARMKEAETNIRWIMDEQKGKH
jgi:hypothetical protein